MGSFLLAGIKFSFELLIVPMDLVGRRRRHKEVVFRNVKELVWIKVPLGYQTAFDGQMLFD